MNVTSIKCECGNDRWEDWFDYFECTNCLRTRKKITRKPKPHTITLSQQKKIKWIKDYLLSTFAGKKYDIEVEEIQTTEFGKIYYTIKTGGNIFVREGGCFSIGSKGKIEVVWFEGIHGRELLKQALRIKEN